MPGAFARATTPPFVPTMLIAALDAARREAMAPPPAPVPAPEPIEPLLEEARRSGWEDGLAEGLRRAAATHEAAAARIAEVAVEALRLGERQAQAAAATVAQDLSRLVLSMLDAALPGLAAAQAAPLAAAFAGRLAPMLEAAPEARLLVPAGLGDAVRALLGGLRVTVEEDAALPPGDARASWRAGGAALDLAARRQAIRAVLESSGLGPKE
jgi:flagellar biosynthesis/type III secretory pathway protein FliH